MRGVLGALLFVCGVCTSVCAQNQAPVVSAGNDTTTRLGLNFSFARTNASDPDGNALTKAWVMVSGTTGGATISDSTALRSAVTFSLTGVYVFSITVSDGTLSASDTIVVTVENELPALVLKPEEGETLFIGSTYDITYQINNLQNPVNIRLSTDDGLTWAILNDGGWRGGVFSWTIDESPSDVCLIEIRMYDASSRLLCTSGTFTIADPSGVKEMLPGGRLLGSRACHARLRVVRSGVTAQGDPLLDLSGRSNRIRGRQATGVTIQNRIPE